MTYNVFGGTLSLTQSVSRPVLFMVNVIICHVVPLVDLKACVIHGKCHLSCCTTHIIVLKALHSVRYQARNKV